MPESQDNQSFSGQTVSPVSTHSALPSFAKDPVQNGEDLLNNLGKTISSQSTPENINFTNCHFKANDILAGKYQIIKFINRGSAGVVYQAKHLMLDKLCAIKMLSPNEITKETSIERFQREAHAAASLTHPNIITVHDFGVLPEGTLYLAMEYLQGQTLAELLEQKNHLNLEQALPIFLQVCLALEYAHNQGVIHRDLKPSNIMLIKDYKDEILTKVIDFSIAKFTRPKPNQRTITKPGEIFGTPLYMSPEQCQGRKPDLRSDIYSLGCVMYQTLCGTPPLMGNSMLTTIFKHVNDLPRPFSEHNDQSNIEPELEAIVFKSLAKLPQDRYQSATELRQALESLKPLHGSSARTPLNKQTGSPHIKEGFQLIILILLACFVIAFCLFLNAKVLH